MKKAQILKRIFLLNAFLAFFVVAFSQAGFKLEVSSHSIGRDEVLQVSYTITNTSQLNSRISVSNFPNWKIVSGPQTSQETTIINGVSSSSIGYIYLLMPQKTGNLSVPGASVMADGKKLTCPSVTVHVTNQVTGNNGGASSSSGSQSSLQSLLNQLEHQDAVESSNTLHQGESATQKIKDNMFVRATPSKKTVYVGEPFSVTYQLYSALGGQSKVTKQPSFNGVSVAEIAKESDPEMVTVGNKKYRAFLIRKVQLIALQPGPISLGTMETSNEVPFASYDDPYHTQTYTETIQNPSVTVEAKPLPTAGKPNNFSGAIGHFSIRVIPQRQSVPVGENDMIHVEITGDGNLLNAIMPDYKWPKGVDHYEAKDSQHVDKSIFPFKVSKVFKIPFIGNQEGKIAFAPISFAYFDPEKGSFNTVQSDPFTIEFTPALPKSKSLGNAFGIDLSGDILNWAIGAILLLGLLIVILLIAKNRKNRTKQDLKERQKKEKQDQSAPWNMEKSNTKEISVKNTSNTIQTNQTTSKVGTEEEKTISQISKSNYALDIQSIMLSTSKTDMYAKGNALICQMLAQYLHSPIETKDILLQKLEISENDPIEKAQITATLNNLSSKINKGLYSPLFTEADRIDFIDELNTLLKYTHLAN